MALPEPVAQQVHNALKKFNSKPDCHVTQAIEAEAVRRFLITASDAEYESVDADWALRSRGQVTATEGAALLSQLNHFDVAQLPPPPSARANAVSSVAQTLELLVRLGFVVPTLADKVQPVLKMLQPQTRVLEESGHLGRASGQYPDIYVPFVLYQGHRSLYNPNGSPNNRPRLAEFIQQSCGALTSNASRKLTAALSKIGSTNEMPPSQLKRLFTDTAATIPLHFEANAAFLQRRFPDFNITTGSRAASPDDQNLGDLMTEMLAAKPATRPTVALKRPLDPTPIPMQAVEPLRRQPPRAEAPLASLAGQPISSSYRGAHSCTSKYHTKYSTADKHGSKDCRFCSTCHMMEFLFNGCRRDCCWKHAPTERKLSMHLGGHPHVLQKAKAQFVEYRTRGYVEPTDIPL